MLTPLAGLLAFSIVFGPSTPGETAVPARVSSRTVLAVDGTRFTVNGKPVFLLGFSYYGALGAPRDFVERDLGEFQRHGFNWLRVWATWQLAGTNISAVEATGTPRQPFLDRLAWLVRACDERGLVVDVTLTRGKGDGSLADDAAHARAVETLVTRLKAHRNWYLDLANERDVRDARFVAAEELKRLRGRVRDWDEGRLVTASFGGHDLTERDVKEAIEEIGLDFLAPHRPRHAGSATQTDAQTRRVLTMMRVLGKERPVHHQEPFRRGYGTWQPRARDFLEDLRGAVAGGAAGWCFHNGTQRGAQDEEPRRSFDLSRRCLMDQLDEEERAVVTGAAAVARIEPD